MTRSGARNILSPEFDRLKQRVDALERRLDARDAADAVVNAPTAPPLVATCTHGIQSDNPAPCMHCGMSG